MRNQPLRIFCLWILVFLSSLAQAQTTSSCFRIESILVDACGNDEGQNEMVRFLVGPNALNTADLNVAWATSGNSWDGVCQNASTSAKVAAMNATIEHCGLLKEPTGGVLPANSKVILISGINFNPALNSFAGLADTLYVIFHCSTEIIGNFANVGSGIRNLSMTFNSPSSCTQTVSYDRSLLLGGDGALAEYTQAGVCSYGNNGCTAPYIVPDPSWTPPAPMCSGAATIDLNTLVTGTPGGYWSGPGVTGHNFSPAGLSGDVDITYTFSPNCADAVSETETISIVSGGSATWTPQTVCSGGGTVNLNTLLTGTTGGTWTGTAVTGNTFDPAGLTGNISITYTVGTGSCQATSTQNINVVASANPAWAFAQSSVCASDPAINLNALITGTTGGTWTGNGVTGSSFSPTGLSGNQTITYTVGTGACVQTSNQTINVIANSDASWTATSICTSTSSLDLNTLVTGTAGGTWSGTGVTGNLFNPAGLTGPQAITYTVGAVACLSTATHDITVITQPVAPLINGTNTFCSGTAITPLTATPAVGSTITWYSDAALTTSVGTGNSYTPPAATATYYATQGVTGCQSPASSFSITLNQSPQPPVLPAQVQWCAGTPLPVLTAVSTAPIITWYSDAAQTMQIGTGLTYPITSSSNASYFVTAENLGCVSAPASTNFIAEPLITAQILGNSLVKACLPKVITFESNSLTGNTWSNGSNQPTISVIQAGVYVLTQQGFCNTSTDTVTLVDMSVNAAFNVEMDETGLLPIDVVVVPLGNEADHCTWFLNGLDYELADNNTFTFTEEAEQTITHICNNQFGCADTATQVVVIELEPELYVPNSFTPNGDNINDVFKISGYEITQLNMRIYDRWGEEIYVITTPDGSWDGTMSSGKLVPDGVYVYHLNARDKHSKPYHFHGSVLLIRYK